MNVMPQNKLDELRRDYECLDEEIADIEEFTEKAGKADKAEGYLAIVLQHELDHFKGILLKKQILFLFLVKRILALLQIC